MRWRRRWRQTWLDARPASEIPRSDSLDLIAFQTFLPPIHTLEPLFMLSPTRIFPDALPAETMIIKKLHNDSRWAFGAAV